MFKFEEEIWNFPLQYFLRFTAILWGIWNFLQRGQYCWKFSGDILGSGGRVSHHLTDLMSHLSWITTTLYSSIFRYFMVLKINIAVYFIADISINIETFF